MILIDTKDHSVKYESPKNKSFFNKLEVHEVHSHILKLTGMHEVKPLYFRLKDGEFICIIGNYASTMTHFTLTVKPTLRQREPTREAPE